MVAISETGKGSVGIAILNTVVRECSTDKVTKKPAYGERVNYEESWRKIFPGGRQSKCKGLEMREPLGSLKSTRKASMAGVE
jgi:hypothetical protein